MSTLTIAPVFRDKLFTLNIALDKQRMRQILASLAHDRLGENIEVRQVGIEVIRRRSQRCVIRYRAKAFDSQKQRRFDWRVIGKLYNANRGERVFETMQQLWESGFSRSTADGISIPEPLEFSSSLCMLFQEEVPGLPVKTIIRQSPQPVHMQQLARTLAKLHQCSVIPDKSLMVRGHLLRCHPRYAFLALACPDLESKIDYIVETAKKIEADFNGIKLAPIHGDFHLGQVHLENGYAWLIDFDSLSYGDPAADLGNVLVILRGKARKVPNISALITAFLDEYFSIMDHDIARRIFLYQGLTHLRRACKCLRLQEEGWQRRAKGMVELGVACIEEMGKNGWHACSQPYLVAEDEDWEEVEYD
jgi:aminoglycoside phosphotransferase (APT) family kinase protein